MGGGCTASSYRLPSTLFADRLFDLSLSLSVCRDGGSGHPRSMILYMAVLEREGSTHSSHFFWGGFISNDRNWMPAPEVVRMCSPFYDPFAITVLFLGAVCHRYFFSNPGISCFLKTEKPNPPKNNGTHGHLFVDPPLFGPCYFVAGPCSIIRGSVRGLFIPRQVAAAVAILFLLLLSFVLFAISVSAIV